MDQDVDTDPWLVEERANMLPQRVPAANLEMYSPGPPPATTQHTPMKMHQDLLQLCSQRAIASPVTEIMRRLKDEGLMERPQYSDFHSEDGGMTGGWLRRPFAEGYHDKQYSSSDASVQQAQYLARLAEQRHEKIHGMKAMGLDVSLVSESGQVTIAASASPSSDAGLKRTESVSSEDPVEMEVVTPGAGRSGRSRPKSTTPVSKNLVSERKRRKKLNDGLYSLRALVPKISKMDKASIVGDAIDYVKELKQEVEDIEMEISKIERKAIGRLTVNESSAGSMLSDCEERASSSKEATEAHEDPIVTDMKTENPSPSHDHDQPPDLKTRILNMEVDKLDEKMYHLKISCQKRPGVLVQLTQAVESLDLDVLNASHTSFQESILNTFIVEMKNFDLQGAEDVRRTLLDVAAQHGLVQA